MSGINLVDIDSLEWIQPEIESSLKKSAGLVDEYEREKDTTALRKGLAHIHEVQGSLQMIELDAAAKVTEAMEGLVQRELERAQNALPESLTDSSSGSPTNGSGISSSLRTGIVGLSHYLKQLMQGEDISPLSLLPAINHLRGAIDEKQFGEIELFEPDLELPLPSANDAKGAGINQGVIEKLREHYSSSLMRFIRHPEDPAPVRIMRDIGGGIARNAKSVYVRKFWAIANAFLSLLPEDGPNKPSYKLLAGRLDPSLRALAAQGEGAVTPTAQNNRLLREMLLEIAQSVQSSEQLEHVRKAFSLDAWVGKDKAADTVSASDRSQRGAALKMFYGSSEKEIEQAQRELAAYFSPGGATPDTLSRLSDQLEHMMSNLSSYENLNPLRDLMGELQTISHALADGWAPDHTQLSLEMAGALLFVQDGNPANAGSAMFADEEWDAHASAITNNLRKLRNVELGISESDAEVARPSSAFALPYAVKAAAQEISGTLTGVEESLEQFAIALGSAAEDDFSQPVDLNMLQGADRQLAQIKGTFDMLGANEAAGLAQETGAVFAGLSQGQIEPKPELLEAQAVAITSLENFVSAMRKNRGVGTGSARGLAGGRAMESVVDAQLVRAREILAEAMHSQGAGAQDLTSRADVLAADLAQTLKTWEQNSASGESNAQASTNLTEKLEDVIAFCGETQNKTAQRLAKQSSGLLDAISLAPESATSGVVDTLRSAIHRVIHALNPSQAIGGALETSDTGDSAPEIKSAPAPVSTPVQPQAVKPGADLLAASLAVSTDSSTAASTPAAAAEVRPAVSTDLLNEFNAETAELLHSVDELRRDWSDNPADAATMKKLSRAFHTLRGSAHVVNEPEMGALAGSCEDLLEPYFEPLAGDGDRTASQPTGEVQDFIGRAQRQLKYLLDNPDARKTFKAQPWQEHANELSSVDAAQDVAEAVASDAVDAAAGTAASAEAKPQEETSLQALFKQEAGEILDRIDQQTATLDNADAEQTEQAMEAVGRELHTLIGAARAAGGHAIGALAESVEGILKVADASQPETAQKLKPLLGGMSTQVKTMLGGEQDVAGLKQLHEQLSSAAFTLPQKPDRFDQQVASAASQADTSTVEEAAAEAESIAEAKTESEPTVVVLDSPDAAPAASVTTPVSVGLQDGQEVVRVSGDALDNLVDYAGEIGASQNWLDDKISDVSEKVKTLGDDVGQVQQQIKELEFETDSGSFSAAEQSDAGFGEPDDLSDAAAENAEQREKLKGITRSLSDRVDQISALQDDIARTTGEAQDTLRQQEYVSADLKQQLLGTRMAPFASYLPRLRSAARAAGDGAARHSLEFIGEQTSADRRVLDGLLPAVEILISDAVQHGFSDDEMGTVNVNFSQAASEIEVVISDNGSGINTAAITQWAEQNLGGFEVAQDTAVDAAGSVLAAETVDVLLDKTFPAADIAPQLQRLREVDASLRSVGGSMALSASSQGGTRISLRTPVSMVISKVLEVKVGSQQYGIPTQSVASVVKLRSTTLPDAQPGRSSRLSYEKVRYPYLVLNELVGAAANPHLQREGHHSPIVFIKSGAKNIAVRVDELGATLETVVKPMGEIYANQPLIAGGAIRGDGSVLLVLDVAGYWDLHRVKPLPETERPESDDSSSLQLRSAVALGTGVAGAGVAAAVAADHASDVEHTSDAVHDTHVEEEPDASADDILADDTAVEDRFELNVGSLDAGLDELAEPAASDLEAGAGVTEVSPKTEGPESLQTEIAEEGLPDYSDQPDQLDAEADTGVESDDAADYDSFNMSDSAMMEMKSLDSLSTDELLGDLSEIDETPPAAETPEAEPADGPTNTVLVVDDSATVRAMLRGDFEGAGYDVVVAWSAEDALEYVLPLPLMAVIDIQLPGMTGLELLENLRLDEKTADLPVIMITGHDDDALREKAKSLGAGEMLTKPYDNTTLMNLVGEMLGDKQASLTS